jgi:hypothetical protein
MENIEEKNEENGKKGLKLEWVGRKQKTTKKTHFHRTRVKAVSGCPWH